MKSNTVETCSCNAIHEETIEKVLPLLLDPETSQTLASFFKVFADSTRLKMISALSESEMCVCDLAVTLNMTHSAISHQLRTFKAANLVKSRKVGNIVYYSLADSHITEIFKQGLEHIRET